MYLNFLYTSSSGVPKAPLSVLWFSLCTLPLSTLISSISLHYHLFADDTQLCSHFTNTGLTPASLAYKITSSKSPPRWMTANLLTISSSKTEFILIGDWQDTQLHTYYHPLCSQPWLQVSAISKACYYHIRQRRCIRPYLDPTTTCTTVTYIVFSKLDYCITVILFTTTYISLRLPASNT